MSDAMAQYHIKMFLRSLQIGYYSMDRAQFFFRTFDMPNFHKHMHFALQRGKDAQYHLQKLIMAHEREQRKKYVW